MNYLWEKWWVKIIFSAIWIVFREEARTQRDQVTKDINILSQENQSLKQSVNALEKDKAEVAVEKDKVGHTFGLFLFFIRFLTVLTLISHFIASSSNYGCKQ